MVELTQFLPFTKISNILQDGSVGSDFSCYEMIPDDENFTLRNGDTVLAMSGATTGKVSVLTCTEDEKYYQNQRVGFFTRKGNFNYDFVSVIVRSHLFIEQLKSVLVAGAQPNVSPKDIDSFEFMVPQKFVEQEKIGHFFKSLDKLITLHQRKFETLKKLKKGFLQKMFPKNGESVPEIRFPGFTDAWEQRKFIDVVEIGSGMDYKHLGEGNIPVYGTGGYMLSVDKALSDDKDAIGIGRKGTIDKPYILRAPFWTVDTLFYCIPRRGYDLDFTSCLFQNVDWKKKDESTGVPSLSKVIINNVEALTPTLAEQKKIGDFFRKLDNLITLHQRKLDTLKKLKQGMLQQMFI